jgi:hypothetical protein
MQDRRKIEWMEAKERWRRMKKDGEPKPSW